MWRMAWVIILLSACSPAGPAAKVAGPPPAPLYSEVGRPVLPEGYDAAVAAGGLADPRAIVFAPDGSPVVVEGTPARLTRVEEGGRLVPLAAGGGNGRWTGAAYLDGHFFVAEEGGPGPGRVLRVEPDGGLTPVMGKLPGGATATLTAGADGWLYVGVANRTNAGVREAGAAGGDIPCQDVELRDGGEIKGRLPCTGSVLRLAPDGHIVELYAWGLRKPVGLAFTPAGQLLAAEQSYRPDPVRRIAGEPDLLWSVTPGVWYGWPDFHAELAMADPLLADYPNPPPAPLATFKGEVKALAVSRDPAFGAPGQAWVALEQPQGTGSVAFADPHTGAIAPFGADFKSPAALAFSPDGAVLWVADAGTGRLWRIWRR